MIRWSCFGEEIDFARFREQTKHGLAGTKQTDVSMPDLRAK